ncbi:hypothetical protein RUM43_003500 [Polyplax serrata]|uniref:BHLH domain-containing protein n=1 Tax=Polyplax serrata TaxID=468196 RepID=A0AAN8PPF7_POLSC
MKGREYQDWKSKPQLLVSMADILERDAGFCSGGDEDDMEAEDGIHSPTDASEDSVDVKVQAISFRNRNKRKCAEPRKVDSDLPAKKRKLDLSVTRDDVEPSSRSPFRPWSASPTSVHPRDAFVPRILGPKTESIRQNELDVILMSRLPTTTSGAQRLFPVQRAGPFSPLGQEEPLSLVSKRKDGTSDPTKVSSHLNPRLPRARACTDAATDVRLPPTVPTWYLPPEDLSSKDIARPGKRATPPPQPSPVTGSYLNVTNKVRTVVAASAKKTKPEAKVKPEQVTHQQSDNKFGIDSLLSSTPTEGASKSSQVGQQQQQGHQGQQRNYKNMTRERRIEANARERTRVHTISAAFDTLRHSIPAYSHNQKLSKLSVLRIACSYIMTLSRLAGYDYSKDQSEPDLANCVDNVSRTIQTEGKVRKKRED